MTPRVDTSVWPEGSLWVVYDARSWEVEAVFLDEEEARIYAANSFGTTVIDMPVGVNIRSWIDENGEM